MPPPMPIAPSRPQLVLDGHDLSDRLVRLVVHDRPGERARCEAELAWQPAVADDAWHDARQARLGVALQASVAEGWRFDGTLESCRVVVAEGQPPTLSLRADGTRDPAAPDAANVASLAWGGDLLAFDATIERPHPDPGGEPVADQTLNARAVVAGALALRGGQPLELQGLGVPASGRFTLGGVSLRWDLQKGATVAFDAQRPLPGF